MTQEVWTQVAPVATLFLGIIIGVWSYERWGMKITLVIGVVYFLVLLAIGYYVVQP